MNETAAIFAAATPIAGLLGVAIWRVSRMDANIKHQSRCQKLLVRAVVKLGREVRKLQEGS